MKKQSIKGLLMALVCTPILGSCDLVSLSNVSIEGSTRDLHGLALYKQELPLQVHSKVRCRTALDLQIYRSETPRIVVSSSDSTRLGDLKVEYRDGAIGLYDEALASERSSHRRGQSIRMLAVDLYLPHSVEALDLSGACIVSGGDPIQGKKLELDCSGASKVDSLSLHVSEVDIDLSGASRISLSIAQAQKVTFDASGASQIKLSGQVGRLDLALSGASKCDLSQLTSQEVEIDASGASKIELGSTQILSYSISGATKMTIPASVRVERASSTGASSVKTK